MVVLKSGREIELHPLNFFQRAEVKDLALEYWNKKVPLSLTVCGKCVLYAARIAETSLNEWTDEDVYEAGGIVLGDLFKSDLDKKK